MEWSAQLEGRVISKKNSKQIRRNRYTGKPFVSTSDAYKNWHDDALIQLLTTRLPSPLTGNLYLSAEFLLKGKMDTDLDNLLSSVCDLLQDAGVIENDKQIIAMGLVKELGSDEFITNLTVSQLP